MVLETTCILQAVASIPSGKVTTYGDLAKALHTSPRAIGQVKIARFP